MKRLLIFALEFFALTAPLTWLWVVADGRELFAANVFVPVADALYALFGLEVRAVWRERYIHFVPFVALVVLTPGLSWRRRLGGLGGGLLVMLLCDVVTNGITQAGHRRPVDLPMPIAVFSDALPFAVWAVVARDFVAELARGALGGASGPRGSASGQGGGSGAREGEERAAPRD